MAGIKGKSGGARINSGGARPGAGRPPNPPTLSNAPGSADPLVFLRDRELDMRLRIDAAKAMMPFAHTKTGEVGKKEEQVTAAKLVSTGRYAPSKPPMKLVR